MVRRTVTVLRPHTPLKIHRDRRTHMRATKNRHNRRTPQRFIQSVMGSRGTRRSVSGVAARNRTSRSANQNREPHRHSATRNNVGHHTGNSHTPRQSRNVGWLVETIRVRGVPNRHRRDMGGLVATSTIQKRTRPLKPFPKPHHYPTHNKSQHRRHIHLPATFRRIFHLLTIQPRNLRFQPVRARRDTQNTFTLP